MRSEPRSNYQSSASVYRGKYSSKYKIKKSIKANKNTDISRGKEIKSYKEKAKNYYLGMKNNWVGNTKINIQHFEDYKINQNDRKSKTANMSLVNSKTVKQRDLESNLRNNKKDPQLFSGSINFKRLNKESYNNKLRESANLNKEVKYSSPKHKNGELIYKEVKSYYENTHFENKRHSKSALRNSTSKEDNVNKEILKKRPSSKRKVIKEDPNYRSIVHQY